MLHIPVLLKEVLQYLDPKPNENFIDCTIDSGGHSLAILEKIKPNGKILGIDWDSELIANLRLVSQKGKNFKNRLVLINDSYVNLTEIVKKNNFEAIDGILFDLGMSSWHLEESGRGFTFLRDEPLDMRYGVNELTAEKIVNEYSENEIERILREYGEERFAKLIARRIIEQREKKPITTTFELKRLIPKKTKLHRTFQALRIAVNDELNNLQNALPQAEEVLKPCGRIVVISFHSLEDRIVKNFFKKEAEKNLLKILTKKPITPSQEEIKINPRSSSAKLRAVEKI